MAETPWQTELLRKSYFFELKSQPADSHIWRKVVGEEPTDRAEKPAVRLVTEIGTWNEHQLTITSQLGRVDVLHQASMTVDQLPNAGSYSAALAPFLALPVPEGLPDINRLAFGAVMLLPRSSHEECYRTLDDLLPHLKLSPTSRDFQYRINNPIESVLCPGIRVNRLSTWSAIRANISLLNPENSLELYAVRVEIDVNTTVETPLSGKEDATAMMNELAEYARLLLVEGANP